MDDYDYSESALIMLGKMMSAAETYANLEFKEASELCPHRKKLMGSEGFKCSRKSTGKSVWYCNIEICPVFLLGKNYKELK